MTRLRVTDRSTGEILVEADAQPDDLATTREHGGAIVLPISRQGGRGHSFVEVVVEGWRFELEVEDASLADLRERATSHRAGTSDLGPTVVRAIIPGRVVSIAVEIGSTVDQGQRLLAVEAMKMENELRAPRAGVVERVAVAVGQTIELGDTLVVLR